MAFPQITCETSNQKCLIYIMSLTLSSTYQTQAQNDFYFILKEIK